MRPIAPFVLLSTAAMPFVGPSVDVVSAASCAADVTSKSATIEEKGDLLAEFTVQPSGCRDFCSGNIRYRVHYLNKKGNAHFFAGGVSWRVNTDQNATANIVDRRYESHCRDTNMGPCSVRNVEVVSVSCVD